MRIAVNVSIEIRLVPGLAAVAGGVDSTVVEGSALKRLWVAPLPKPVVCTATKKTIL